MNYVTGSIVVLSVFNKFKVGTVIDKSPCKGGSIYSIKTEDGRIYDDVVVNDSNNSVFINSSITKSFLKSQQNGDNKK